jgi:hypothetical protein
LASYSQNFTHRCAARLHGETTMHAIPVELLHLVNIKDPREKGRPPINGEPSIPETGPSPMYRLPATSYQLLPSSFLSLWRPLTHFHQCHSGRLSLLHNLFLPDAPLALLGKSLRQTLMPSSPGSSSRSLRILQQLREYTTPSRREISNLSNLRIIKKNRIERLRLPSGLIDRMKGSIKA